MNVHSLFTEPRIELEKPALTEKAELGPTDSKRVGMVDLEGFEPSTS